MWTYHQATGELLQDNVSIGFGYAGRGIALNNPRMQFVDNQGPIPAGLYAIGAAFTHALAGPLTMRLVPGPANDMHGRDGFLMHGDTASQDQTASHGCIIMARLIRTKVSMSGDKALTVIE